MNDEIAFDDLDTTAPGPDAPQEPDTPEQPARRRPKQRMTFVETELRLGPFLPNGATEAEHDGQRIPVERGIASELVQATVTTLKGRKGWTRAVARRA